MGKRGKAGRTVEQALDMLMAERVISEDTGCWQWPGRKVNGYGVIRAGGRAWLVHRLMAHLHLGLTDGKRNGVVMHSCDNPACYNPAHLSIGTDADNRKDAQNKGRFPIAGQSAHSPYDSKAKPDLTPFQVREIRRKLPLVGHHAIAREYKLSSYAVARIRSREWFGDVE